MLEQGRYVPSPALALALALALKMADVFAEPVETIFTLRR
jgi:DNA-binding XRE family transcriptional regulator